MGRLTWSTGLDMLSPCRGCSPPPPPPGPSASARRKSMLAASGDRLSERPCVPVSLPRGKRGPDYQPRAGSLRPGSLWSVWRSSKKKILSGTLELLGGVPTPQWHFALWVLSFCPVALARQLPAGGRCLVQLSRLLCLQCLKCQAAPKVERRSIQQVEPRSPPPRAAKCQRGLSAAGVFGFSPVTFSFDRSRWEWGRGGREEEEEGEGRGAQSSTATDGNTNTAAADLLYWGQGALMEPPNPIALLRAGAVPGHLPRESCSPALAQERQGRR